MRVVTRDERDFDFADLRDLYEAPGE